MPEPFVLRAGERGDECLPSTGDYASYVAGHPDAVITRRSSFNFHSYQSGRPGFGSIRVFGDEIFSGAGCGYNMHPHHNFIIMAFVLAGTLTHVNTVGKVDQLHAGDYYVFSAGAGGKHCELNLEHTDLHVLYLWVLPDHLLLPPSYLRASYDAAAGRDRIVPLVGPSAGALPIAQDLRVSRLTGDPGTRHAYAPAAAGHGVYAFVIEGAARCGGVDLARRDSAGFVGGEPLACEARAPGTDLLLVETAP